MNKTLTTAVKSLTVTLVAGTAIFASAGLASAQGEDDLGPWGVSAAPTAKVQGDLGPWAPPAKAQGDLGPW
ncbi:hypothetical protein [Streptomyces sp. NPDC002054]|uniref:hypothetical protein n=1 Tax=Streptomyces sp. NPDC002054 TaxID=3154663 RepID=UPI00331FE9E6